MIAMVRAVARMPALRHLQLSTTDPARVGIYADSFGPGGIKKGYMVGMEPAFHNAHLGEPRWVLSLRNLDNGWSIPPDLRAALTKSSGEGRVYVIGAGGQEEQF